MHRVRAGDDAALRRPENRVIVVRARGDVDEEVEHRVVVHERRRDGHGAGRHGEGVLSASLVGQVERAAVLVGDRQRFERIALIGRDGDGHSAALGGRLRADAHTAVRAVRDRNVIARRGGDRCVDFLPFRRQGQIFCHRRVKVPFCICNGIFNHTLLCEFHQGKLLLHLTIPFEEKPKTNLPSDNLKYYRQRKQMTTRQLAEKMDIVPSTVVMYENGKHPIPYNVAIKLADVLEIEASLLYDDFSRFLSVPYTEALKSVRTALGLSQKAFAERIGLVPSYYYKIEEGNRRPSRKVYQKIYAALETTSLQTSLLGEHPLQ